MRTRAIAPLAAGLAVVAVCAGFGAPDGPKPIVETLGPTSVTQTSAVLNGTVNPNGAPTTYHFEYGTSAAYGTQAPVPDGSAGTDSSDHAEAQGVSGLTPNTTYHFRLYASNAFSDGEPSFGTDEVFTTLSQAPTVTTSAATAVTQTAATLNAVVNPEGVPTTYHFEYGTSAAYGRQAPVPDGSAGTDGADHAEAQTVSGLAAATVYHFRIVATNSGGTSYGTDATFTTAAEPVSGGSCTVPDLFAFYVTTARSLLGQLGCATGAIKWRYTRYPKGWVLGETPAARTRLAGGKTVVLLVSNGPKRPVKKRG